MKFLSFLVFVFLAAALLLTRCLHWRLAAFRICDARLQLWDHLTDVFKDLSSRRQIGIDCSSIFVLQLKADSTAMKKLLKMSI